MTHALITGAGKGIGRALAFALLEEGLELSLMGRPSSSLFETERALTERGAVVRTFACDLGDQKQVAQAAQAVLTAAGPPDVVVHNAATIERGVISQLSDEAWDTQIEVNLSAPFRLTRALLPAMLARNSGRILFVSSISAVVGTKGSAAYNASKAGLVGLMRCLAEELSETGLFTMALLPGSVDTDMLAGSGFSPRMSPEEVARTLRFYATDADRGHNGACVEMFGI